MRITPSMQQYLDLKKAYSDCILLFQMGDFYETFFEDAKIIAKELNIVLTSREKNNPIPMAGFPIKALDTYLPKLIKKGYKVAIAEQVEDPKNAKGLVKRKVVEVVTTASYIGEHALENSKSRNIATLYFNKRNKLVTIAYAEILGKDIIITKLPLSQELIMDFLHTQNITELVIEQKQLIKLNSVIQKFQFSTYNLTNKHNIKNTILEHFKVSNLMALGLEEENQADLAAIKILLDYFEFLKGTPPFNITSVKFVDFQHRMYLDLMTLKNLEVLESYSGHSLFQTINFTLTPMGYRYLFDNLRAPLRNRLRIINRLNEIDFFVNNPSLIDQIRQKLSKIYDIERLTGLIGLERIKPKQARQLALSLNSVIQILNILKPQGIKILSKETAFPQEEEVKEIINIIDFFIQESPANNPTEGPIINDENFPKIKELRRIVFNTQEILNNYLRNLKEKLKVEKLKVGFNKIYGYYFEVPKGLANEIPKEYPRKQTLVNSIRFITPELQQFENKIQSAEEELYYLENAYYQEFLKTIRKFIKPLQKIASFVAHIDFILNGAFITQKYNYTKPDITKERTTKIKEGRHPVIETITEEFIPNDIVLDQNTTFIILTGPNMGGKSTFIRQTALIQLLAQIGYYVPAKQARLSIKDRIFARVGASDNISKGLSTFMVEMSEVATIINNSTEESLIILDEVGRGTSTLEGVALAQAISEYIIKNIKAHTLFATHYYELTQLEQKYKSVKNLKVEVFEENGNVVFLHKVSEGAAEKSYGIHIARMVKLPTEIIELAEKLLANFNQRQININLINQQIPPFSSKRQTSPIKQLPLIALEPNPKYSELVKILKSIDINNITPLKALEILNKLQKIILE